MWKDRRKRGLRWMIALAALGSGACAKHAAPGPPGADHAETTVVVENTGIEAVAVYSNRRSTRLGTVMPGRSICLELPSTFETQRLVARPIAGGDAVLSPQLDQRPGNGWEWSVGTNTVADELSLVPHARCEA